jgi:hypothetical protein
MYGTRFIIYKEYSIRSSYIERSIPKELYIRAPPAVAVFLSPAGAKACIWIYRSISYMYSQYSVYSAVFCIHI